MPLPTVHHRHRQSACGWAGQAEDDYRQERPRHRQVSHSRSVSCPSSVVVHGLRALCFLLVTEARKSLRTADCPCFSSTLLANIKESSTQCLKCTCLSVSRHERTWLITSGSVVFKFSLFIQQYPFSSSHVVKTMRKLISHHTSAGISRNWHDCYEV